MVDILIVDAFDQHADIVILCRGATVTRDADVAAVGAYLARALDLDAAVGVGASTALTPDRDIATAGRFDRGAAAVVGIAIGLQPDADILMPRRSSTAVASNIDRSATGT